jgi:hypothetical protein
MKLTSVELHPDGSPAFCALSFRDPSRLNPYNVKGMSGLDADDIVPSFYGVPGTTAFYNMMLAKRTVVAKVELNPRYNLGEDPSFLRDELYKMIASSRTGLVHIHFKNDDELIATISGFITKLEAAHFQSTPEVLITIACTEPMLKAPNEVSLDVVTLDPSLTTIIDDVSTAPHGFKFQVTFTGDLASFVISDPGDADWEFEIIPLNGFDTGDELYYSSEYNNKYLYIVRGGSIIHLADVITMGSHWPVMFPGENNLSIENGTSIDWESISYFPTFWGV